MSVNMIHVLGATGSGTTTLGQAIEREFGYKWLCTDHAFWFDDHVPFQGNFSHEERLPRILAGVEKHPKCVLAGSLCIWGDILIPKIDLVVFIYTPAEVRKERLKKRNLERYGDRAHVGGDLYENCIGLIEYAMKYDTATTGHRSKQTQEKWISERTCPVVRLSGLDTSERHLELLREYLGD